MALKYDLTACDAEAIKEHQHWIGVLSYAMMFIGMGSIDEKNIDEVWARIRMFEATSGPIASSNEYITRDTVHAHIGGQWNVAHESRRKFETRLSKLYIDVLKRKLA